MGRAETIQFCLLAGLSLLASSKPLLPPEAHLYSYSYSFEPVAVAIPAVSTSPDPTSLKPIHEKVKLITDQSGWTKLSTLGFRLSKAHTKRKEGSMDNVGLVNIGNMMAEKPQAMPAGSETQGENADESPNWTIESLIYLTDRVEPVGNISVNTEELKQRGSSDMAEMAKNAGDHFLVATMGQTPFQLWKATTEVTIKSNSMSLVEPSGEDDVRITTGIVELGLNDQLSQATHVIRNDDDSARMMSDKFTVTPEDKKQPVLLHLRSQSMDATTQTAFAYTRSAAFPGEPLLEGAAALEEIHLSASLAESTRRYKADLLPFITLPYLNVRPSGATEENQHSEPAEKHDLYTNNPQHKALQHPGLDTSTRDKVGALDVTSVTSVGDATVIGRPSLRAPGTTVPPLEEMDNHPSEGPLASWQISGTEISESTSASVVLPLTAPPPGLPMDNESHESTDLTVENRAEATEAPQTTEKLHSTSVWRGTLPHQPRLKSGLEELESEEEHDGEDEEDEDIEESEEESQEEPSEMPTAAPVPHTYSHTTYHLHSSSIWVQQHQGLVRSWVETIRDKAGYVSGMLAPVGIGIAGALFILGALYSIRMMHRKRRSSFKQQRRKPRETNSRQDRMMLLAGSSEDEL